MYTPLKIYTLLSEEEKSFAEKYVGKFYGENIFPVEE